MTGAAPENAMRSWLGLVALLDYQDIAPSSSFHTSFRSPTCTTCDEWSQYTGLNDCGGASNTLIPTLHGCLDWVFRRARRIA